MKQLKCRKHGIRSPLEVVTITNEEGKPLYYCSACFTQEVRRHMASNNIFPLNLSIYGE